MGTHKLTNSNKEALTDPVNIALRNLLLYRIEVSIINRGLCYFFAKKEYQELFQGLMALESFINHTPSLSGTRGSLRSSNNILTNTYPFIIELNNKLNHPKIPLEQCFAPNRLTKAELDKLQEILTSINWKLKSDFKMNSSAPFDFYQWLNKYKEVYAYNENSIFSNVNFNCNTLQPIVKIKQRADDLLIKIKELEFNKNKVADVEMLVDKICAIDSIEYESGNYNKKAHRLDKPLDLATVKTQTRDEFLRDMKNFYIKTATPHQWLNKEAKNFSIWFNKHKYFIKSEKTLASTLLAWHLHEKAWQNNDNQPKKRSDEELNQLFKNFNLSAMCKSEINKRTEFIKRINEKINIFEKTFQGKYLSSKKSNDQSRERYRNILGIYWDYKKTHIKGLDKHPNIKGEFSYFRTQFSDW
ncbi:MAG: hypothetical protein MJK12_02985 [Colwellia sp.]|nr:hypothetical protein [Colwellia sp.]